VTLFHYTKGKKNAESDLDKTNLHHKILYAHEKIKGKVIPLQPYEAQRVLGG
jgi:hypothetical protein